MVLLFHSWAPQPTTFLLPPSDFPFAHLLCYFQEVLSHLAERNNSVPIRRGTNYLFILLKVGVHEIFLSVEIQIISEETAPSRKGAWFRGPSPLGEARGSDRLPERAQERECSSFTEESPRDPFTRWEAGLSAGRHCCQACGWANMRGDVRLSEGGTSAPCVCILASFLDT